MAHGTFRIRQAETGDDLIAVRALVTAYADSLGIDLSFQNVDAELANLPGAYAPPTGALLLAEDSDGTVLGVVALRPLDGGICEMKRLYVPPAGRGRGVGRDLVAAILDAARTAGHARMRLDTLPDMAGALSLYRAAGFQPVPPYYDTPVPGTLFFELKL